MDGNLFTRLFKEFRGIDENVVGVGKGKQLSRGVSTGRDAVLIFVKEKRDLKSLKRQQVLPREIKGTVTDVIEVGNIKLLSAEDNPANTQDIRIGLLRPAQPGVSIGHYQISAGTLGCLVKERNTDQLCILSNNHVLANLTDGTDGRSQIGDPIYQPGVYDGGNKESLIGYLEKFVPLYKEEEVSHCKYANIFEKVMNRFVGLVRPNYRIQVLKRNERYNDVDCAIAKVVDEKLVLAEILECGKIAGIKQAVPSMMIKKSGRTTGVTYGMVLATDVTLSVGISDKEYAVFTNQLLGTPMSMPGDSGSLVLTEDNFAVGLLFAGSQQATMFTPIQNVLDAIHADLVL